MIKLSRAKRKLEHIKHALDRGTITYNSFDEMDVIHQSLTNVNWDEISLETKVGELLLSSPLFVNAMTGGGGIKTEEINRNLAIAARETGIAIAVGSQMSALKNPVERTSYKVVRKENPSGIVFANLGTEASIQQAKDAVEMLEANALQIHLNTLQELIMPEGDRDFSQRLERIESIIGALSVPVIIKEVGFGMSKETADQLREIGVKYIDVAGKGGTNFSQVENKRRSSPIESFNQWGVPTVISLHEVKRSFPECSLISSGGMRNGLDGVKAMVLGAEAFGMAGHLLEILLEDGVDELIKQINLIHDEVKIAMTVLGVEKPSLLSGKPYVLFGKTKDWLEQRL